MSKYLYLNLFLGRSKNVTGRGGCDKKKKKKKNTSAVYVHLE